MIDPATAMRQAWMTASDYARFTLSDLLNMLDIDSNKPGWRKEFAPFAPAWAAMITASARDFDTAMKSGVVETATD